MTGLQPAKQCESHLPGDPPHGQQQKQEDGWHWGALNGLLPVCDVFNVRPHYMVWWPGVVKLQVGVVVHRSIISSGLLCTGPS